GYKTSIFLSKLSTIKQTLDFKSDLRLCQFLSMWRGELWDITNQAAIIEMNEFGMKNDDFNTDLFFSQLQLDENSYYPDQGFSFLNLEDLHELTESLEQVKRDRSPHQTSRSNSRTSSPTPSTPRNTPYSSKHSSKYTTPYGSKPSSKPSTPYGSKPHTPYNSEPVTPYSSSPPKWPVVPQPVSQFNYSIDTSSSPRSSFAVNDGKNNTVSWSIETETQNKPKSQHGSRSSSRPSSRPRSRTTSATASPSSSYVPSPKSPKSPKSPVSSSTASTLLISGASVQSANTSTGFAAPNNGLRSPNNGLASPNNGLASPNNGLASPNNGPAASTNSKIPRHKRESHINAELRRRGKIKNGFDELTQLVPSIQNESGKDSKSTMLLKTAKYARQLKTENLDLQKEAASLKLEIQELNHDVSTFQEQLPDVGLDNQEPEPMKEDTLTSKKEAVTLEKMFDDYVRARTFQNWKFWIFGIIARPMFETYNQNVVTTSMEEFCSSTLTWLQQHCSLISLRPIILSAVRNLSKHTSVMSNPEKLKDEAINAAIDETTPIGQFKS
ncbi:unnamed protein product, partial [Owenia fusiformis]